MRMSQLSRPVMSMAYDSVSPTSALYVLPRCQTPSAATASVIEFLKVGSGRYDPPRHPPHVNPRCLTKLRVRVTSQPNPRNRRSIYSGIAFQLCVRRGGRRDLGDPQLRSQTRHWI